MDGLRKHDAQKWYLLIFFIAPILIGGLFQIGLSFLWSNNSLLGLLRNRDWIEFHEKAVLLNQKSYLQILATMSDLGTGVLVGLLATLYKFFHASVPAVFLLMNGICLGCFSILIYKMMNLLVKNDQKNGRYILPLSYLLFPSSLLLYAQIHKDTFVLLGITLILYSVICIYAESDDGISLRWSFQVWGATFLGACLLYLFRPYLVSVLALTCCLALLCVLWMKGLRWRSTLLSVLLIFSFVLPKSVIGVWIHPVDLNDAGLNRMVEWREIPGVPTFIDRTGRKLAQNRQDFIHCCVTAQSNIDEHITFGSLEDIILYVPRALQISLLGPLMLPWSKSDSFLKNAERFVGKIEALFFLVSVVVAFALLIWAGDRRSLAVLMLCSLFYLVPTVVQALAIVNMGTLYRMRLCSSLPLSILSLYFCQRSLFERYKRQ